MIISQKIKFDIVDTQKVLKKPPLGTIIMEVVISMGRLMSKDTMYELAKELGFAHKVQDGDWGNITTREAGSLVKAAVEKAQILLAQKENGRS